MSARCFSLVGASVARLTRLDGCGRPQYGDCSQVVTEGFVSIQATAQIDEGDDILVRNAGGKVCVSKKARPLLTGYNVDINFCNVDPDLFAMATNQSTVLDPRNGDAIGFRVNVDVNSDDAGFALEAWSEVPGVECPPEGEEAEGAFGYTLFPFLKGGVFGDFTLENDAVTFTLQGASTKSGSGWGVGPYDVTFNELSQAGPLTDPIGRGDHLHVQLTYVAPPEPDCGCIPLDNPGAPAATGATEGAPGAFTPAGANRPADLAALQASSISATPSTNWDADSYVILDDGSRARWNGTAWVAWSESGATLSTGATAGTPGTWTPPGSEAPETVAELQASDIVASPATAWTTGQNVQTQTAGAPGQAHWSGTAWLSGPA
jgi:hypothetical protein